MIHGPASITVTGIAVPFSPNTWVMPTFLPNNPLSISYPLFLAVGVSLILQMCFSPKVHKRRAYSLYDTPSLQLDFDVHACGQIQSCQCLNSLVGRLNNINLACMWG